MADGRTPFRRRWLPLAAVALLAACGQDAGAPPAPVEGAAKPDPADPPRVPVVSERDASRFLKQASFGPTMAEIEAISLSGYEAWFLDQLDAAPTRILPGLEAALAVTGDVDKHAAHDAHWEAMVVGADQLRLRTSFALSQVLVVSTKSGGLQDRPLSVAYYMDVLNEGAFGNYRDLLEEVTYAPAMARYLTYYKNQKANPQRGSVPDENYAREVMQLFTIGLVALNPDGTAKAGAPETYTNDDVEGLAKVFTGLGPEGAWNAPAADADWSRLSAYDDRHSEARKTFLGLTIPAGTGAEDSIDRALDHLFADPNVPPFVSRQLIQRLVTSAPAPAYTARVAQAFAQGRYVLPSGTVVGTGERGDLSATVAAVLFDAEARRKPEDAPASFGKVREPVLRLAHWARAFEVADTDASTVLQLRNASGASRLGQQAYQAPSVFNFFRPGYVAPGTRTGGAGLTAPELQATSEATQIGVINALSKFARSANAGRGDGVTPAWTATYAAERALADDPAALIARLDLLLTDGRMTQQTRTAIEAVIGEVALRPDTLDADRLKRVELAVVMAMTAPEAQVQR